MADRMAAEIWIGGRLQRKLLDEMPLSADMMLDWDDRPLGSVSEASLLAACQSDGLLHFCDAEAAWGQFEELEDWLREHRLPFRRRSFAKYEYLPELIEFRPDLAKRAVEVNTLTTDDGEPVICKSSLAPILAEMAKLRRSERPLSEQLRAWKRLSARLVKLLPPDLPPLPSFEIV